MLLILGMCVYVCVCITVSHYQWPEYTANMFVYGIILCFLLSRTNKFVVMTSQRASQQTAKEDLESKTLKPQ